MKRTWENTATFKVEKAKLGKAALEMAEAGTEVLKA